MNITKNQIRPATIPNVSSSVTSTIEQVEFSEHLRRHVSNRFCYYLPETDIAELVQVTDCVGFICHIWTLTDERKVKKKWARWNRDIACPSERVGHIWFDYQFAETPKTADIRGMKCVWI